MLWTAGDRGAAPARFMAVLAALCSVAGGLSGAAAADRLSVNGAASLPSAAIDAAGDAFAAWFDKGAYFASRPAGLGWSVAEKLPSSVAPGTDAVLHATAGGAATLVSYQDLYGIWAADRPAGGLWGPATEIVTGVALLRPMIVKAAFVADTAGDQAVVYQDWSGPANRLMAVRRMAGAAGWGAPEMVVSSADAGEIALAGAAMGEAGDLVMVWESYSTACGRRCNDVNFVVHASRAGPVGGAWVQSGALTASNGFYGPWKTQAAVDPAGRAVVLSQPGYRPSVQASEQAGSQAAWTGPVTAFSAPKQSLGQMWGMGAGAGGRASFAMAAFTSGAADIRVVDGMPGSGTWRPGANLALHDARHSTNGVAFADSASGSAVAEWTDDDGTVRAAFRDGSGARWSAARTVQGAAPCYVLNLQCTQASAAAVDPAGHALMLFIRADENDTTQSLYAVMR